MSEDSLLSRSPLQRLVRDRVWRGVMVWDVQTKGGGCWDVGVSELSDSLQVVEFKMLDFGNPNFWFWCV